MDQRWTKIKVQIFESWQGLAGDDENKEGAEMENACLECFGKL